MRITLQLLNLAICIKMFDNVKLSNFEKVKKVVVLDDFSRSPECSTASSCSRRVEQSYFHVFFFVFLRSVLRIASCIGPNFVNFCITLLTFSSVHHY